MKHTKTKNKRMKKLLLVSIFALLIAVIGAVLLLERNSVYTSSLRVLANFVAR